MKRIWFIDANVLANWVMARGGVIEVLHRHINLPQDFIDAYVARHERSLAFIDGVMAHSYSGTDTFYTSHLAVNEVWKAIKEEATAMLQFQAGTPLSLWKDGRNRPSFSEPLVEAIYESTVDAMVGRLFSNDTVQVVQEANQTDDGYFDAFVPILFLPDFMMTMDATLVTTAFYYDADHFVSRDRALRDGINRTFRDRMRMKCVKPEEAHRILSRS